MVGRRRGVMPLELMTRQGACERLAGHAAARGGLGPRRAKTVTVGRAADAVARRKSRPRRAVCVGGTERKERWVVTPPWARYTVNTFNTEQNFCWT